MTEQRVKTTSAMTSSLDNWEQREKEQPVTKRYQFDALKSVHFWAYAVGHVLNDLCAACWFNYLLFYLKYVIKIDYGAYAMLSGQIADAIGTPLVGYLSDKTNTRLGKRIPWYIGGYLIVVISFLPVWNGPLILGWIGETDDEAMQYFYYIFFPAVFNFGWAALQIAHMSLVPSLTCCRTRRDRLNSLRNTFQFVAVMIVYIIAVNIYSKQIIFFQDDSTEPIVAFRFLSLICVGLGTATSLFFLFNIQEPYLSKQCRQMARKLTKILADRSVGVSISIDDPALNKVSEAEGAQSLLEGGVGVSECEFDKVDDKLVKQKVNRGSMGEEITSWKHWFSQMAFYRYGMVYMGVRLYCNVSSTMISFFIQKVLKFNGDINNEEEFKIPIQVAIIPLSLYIMSVLTSALLPRLYDEVGKKITITIGTALCVGSSAALIFLNQDNNYLMYAISPVIGVAQAITLNTGITLISDVIGLRGSSGAFVFGAYSFLDKLSAGIVLFFCAEGTILDNEDYVRWITVLVPSVSCVFGWILVVTAEAKKQEISNESVKRKKSLSDELAT